MGQIKLKNESDILNVSYRQRVIEEITGTENITRKNEMLKRYEVYKDRTIKWIVEALLRENLKPETIAQMENRAANISIARKIVNKRARSYKGGALREFGAQGQEKFTKFYQLLDVDQRMKKADQYRELFKNCMLQVIPELCTPESTEAAPKFKVKVRVLAPFQYDVIEDYYDHEIPRVVILSDFVERNRYNMGIEPGTDGRATGITPVFHEGDRVDQIIADSPEDAGSNMRTFIWWSDHYHFTTDDKGEIIPELGNEKNQNPIQELNFVNVAEEQDGEFWARGGDDLIDGSILINKLITDMNSIAFIQGWGQMVITGKSIPATIKGGPHNAIILEHGKDDPTPSVTYQSGNPPLDVWMKMIEQYIALLLSTNDLSPSHVAAKLESPGNAASGIALLIEQSEATDSVEMTQNSFKNVERQLVSKTAKWHNVLAEKNALAKDFFAIGQLPEQEFSIKFLSNKAVTTEAEKLGNLKLRKDLGINTMLDLIKMDNPDMTDEQAEEKLLQITKERLERMSDAMEQAIDQSLPKPAEMQKSDPVDQEDDTPDLNASVEESPY